MARTTGTIVRGIRAPVVKTGDDVVAVVVDALRASWENDGYALRDRDVVGITESLVARAQGNYVTVDDIANDIRQKYPGDVGVVFPILSRNRFSMILKGIARGADRIHLLLSYPADEVGNHLMDPDRMDELRIDPFRDVLSESDYERLFGSHKHGFTGIDYVRYYRDVGRDGNIAVTLANDPTVVLRHTRNVLAADIHTRQRTKRRLKEAGAEKVYGLDDICAAPVAGRGYNEDFGLLGSNMATEDRLKLFPRNGRQYVEEVQRRLKELTGKNVEVMIYGDGAYKDPREKIWELADPVVSPAFTPGLAGMPSELKLKYLADNQFGGLRGEDVTRAMRDRIRGKEKDLVGKIDSQGTTPRMLTDLLGSLCDLTSGSGDKGTPVILIQGYFDTYASD